MLAVIETHPIQYHAPVYRALQTRCGVPVRAIYGSDFSVAGYTDREFAASFAWDTDLLSGYGSTFLSRVAEGGATSAEAVSPAGLRSALEALRPAAVLIVGYSPHFHRVAWREAWRAGYPVLFRGETSDEAQPRNWLKSGARRAALGLAYRTCERLLYIGARSRAHFERLGVKSERLVFSPYCVDVTSFDADEAARTRLRPDARRELGVDDGHVVLLYAGKLSHRKGVDLIMRSVRVLPPAMRQRIVVVFLGDGDRRAELVAQADEEPQVRARFLGFQNQTCLSRYYHAADLLVLPSRRSETWGLVVNEALHHGLPCVVSDQVGCVPDLIEDGVTGAVFQTESTVGLAAAIESTRSLSGDLRIREACRQTVARYSVDGAAQGIRSAYAAVVANGRARTERVG
jgi:glycosyltransferase involved in cell wall biosynthesis